MISVRRVNSDFDSWGDVLALILDAFAYMNGRIEPESSANRLTVAQMAEQAHSGTVYIAETAGRVVGCMFCKVRGDALYLGKLAVSPDCQGQGIGRLLLAEAETEARARGLSSLELEARIELTENHDAFASMGFERVGTSAHPGFDRPTSITMRRLLTSP